MLFPTIDISSALAVAVVFCVGGLLYLDQAISLGTVVAATLYLRQLGSPIDTILIWVETLQSSLASFARIEGMPPQPVRPPRHRPVPVDEHIVISDVHFAYDEIDVLHGVDLDLRPGEQLAVVASGAGRPRWDDSSPASTALELGRSPSAVRSSPTYHPSCSASTSSWSPKNTTSSPTPFVTT